MIFEASEYAKINFFRGSVRYPAGELTTSPIL